MTSPLPGGGRSTVVLSLFLSRSIASTQMAHGSAARCVPVTTEALVTVDVREAVLHYSVPGMVYQSRRRYRVMVEVAGSFQDGSIIDLTSTDIAKVLDSDEKEWDMGDGRTLSLASRCMSHVLFYLAGDRSNTLRGAVDRRIWTRRTYGLCLD